MSEPTRHEILEERGNRDAYYLARLLVLVLLALIAVMGIGAWRLSVILMPIVPRDLPSRAPVLSAPRVPDAPQLKMAHRPSIARGAALPFWREVVRQTKTCRPVPSTSAPSPRASLMLSQARPAKAQRPSSLPALAAGLQQISTRRDA